MPYNKRMQTDLTKRYALASAADAVRYMPVNNRSIADIISGRKAST